MAPDAAERIAIESDADVVTARQRARTLAVELEMPSTDQTLLATAISEIARNITTYANGGRGEVLIDARPRRATAARACAWSRATRGRGSTISSGR